MRHVWSVLCDRCVTDKATNNISMDVIEQLQANIGRIDDPAKLTILPMQLKIVSFWTRTDEAVAEEGRGRIQVYDPFGKSYADVESSQFKIDLTNTIRSRSINEILGMGIFPDKQGTYAFGVEVFQGGKWEEVARLPLQVALEFTAS